MNKYTYYPTKYISVSSSVLVIRRAALESYKNQSLNKCDYEILMLKRNPKTSFGGFYAFPGGVVEK
jgi:ADP-ribose pyrophosphatase YjhB (NUDIX family)